MPWELTIVNYDGKPPRLASESLEDKCLPLGSLDEVRVHISSVLPETEWVTEPPLIEIMKQTGSDSWKDWSPEMIATASLPKLKGYFEKRDLFLEMYGFEQDGPLRYLLIEVRGDADPIPTIRALCSPKGWSAHEMCRDAEFLDLDNDKHGRWRVWERFRDFAIGHARRNAGDGSST